MASGAAAILSPRLGGTLYRAELENTNSPREKRKGSKPISPPEGTSEMIHCTILLMETAKDHRRQTEVKFDGLSWLGHL